jgi:hypothetical protein
MGDCRSVGRLLAGPDRVRVDPIIVAGRCREGVDLLLGDRNPFTDMEFGPDELAGAGAKRRFRFGHG